MAEDAEARPFQARPERGEQPQVLEAAAREDDRSRTARRGARGREGGGDALVEGCCDLLPRPAGGEAAVREPWRIAAAHLERLGRPVPWERWELVRQSLSVNAPLSSGAGRLFDACSALLGVRERISYEGQAAIELEHLAGAVPAPAYSCAVHAGIALERLEEAAS